jgi:hypothetical protein
MVPAGGSEMGPHWGKSFLHVLLLEKGIPSLFKYKGPSPHQRRDNHKKCSIGWGSFKSILQNPFKPEKLILHENFLPLCNIKFTKSMVPRDGEEPH